MNVSIHVSHITKHYDSRCRAYKVIFLDEAFIERVNSLSHKVKTADQPKINSKNENINVMERR